MVLAPSCQQNSRGLQTNATGRQPWLMALRLLVMRIQPAWNSALLSPPTYFRRGAHWMEAPPRTLFRLRHSIRYFDHLNDYLKMICC
jgi:hypothetical protein